jgi:glycosyltransferase involved in cell wall biosynthesis
LSFALDERRLCFVVPAFQAEKSIAAVVRGLLDGARRAGNWTEPSVVVVDDGSTDATAESARDAGAEVLRHPVNRGKGRALLTGFRAAFDRGARAAVSVDADGQHPPEEALKIALDPAPPDALVLAVRDLLRDGAPKANRFSNGFSNVWMSWFARRPLRDTQCGLRRYPLPATLELGLLGSRFELESEVILRAVRRGIPIVEVPSRVLYPEERTSHFRSARDPTRIVLRLLHTAATTRFRRADEP